MCRDIREPFTIIHLYPITSHGLGPQRSLEQKERPAGGCPQAGPVTIQEFDAFIQESMALERFQEYRGGRAAHLSRLAERIYRRTG